MQLASVFDQRKGAPGTNEFALGTPVAARMSGSREHRQQSTYIVRARWALLSDEPSDFIEDGAVLVINGKIGATGTYTELRKVNPSCKVVATTSHLLMPGLVNAHHHSFGVPTSLHGIADAPLESWLQGIRSLRPLDARLSAMWTACQMLQTGVTTMIDMCGLAGSAENVDQSVRGKMDGYASAGIRAVVAPGIRTMGFLLGGDGEDERFAVQLPPAIRKLAATWMAPSDRVRPEQFFDLFHAWHAAASTQPHIDLWFGPPGLQWVERSVLEEINLRAERYDTGIQTHALESRYEQETSQRSRGQSVIAYLDSLGILTPRLSLAHGVHLSDADIGALAGTGVIVVSNPGSNLRLHCGIAPVGKLRAMQIPVALGMDATTLNDDDDMFAEMRLAWRLHSNAGAREPGVGARDVFAMATRVGAQHLGRSIRIGMLRPGFKADLVLLRLNELTSPWVSPEADPFILLMTRAKARHVDMVIVDGEVVLENGQPTRFDKGALASDIADALSRTSIPRGDLESAAALDPFIQRWLSRFDSARRETDG